MAMKPRRKSKRIGTRRLNLLAGQQSSSVTATAVLPGSMGTSRPYSVRAKRAFGAQMPPESIIQPLLSRTVASQRIRNPELCQPGPSKLPSAGAALAGVQTAV